MFSFFIYSYMLMFISYILIFDLYFLFFYSHLHLHIYIYIIIFLYKIALNKLTKLRVGWKNLYMLNDLKECDKIIFEVGVNIPNYYIRVIHLLG